MASVAEIIRQHLDEIVARWSVEARAAASARGLSAPSLMNIMEVFISSLAERAELGDQAAMTRRHEAVLGHLATRIQQGFELAEVIREFNALEAIIAQMSAQLPTQDKPAEADVERTRQDIHEAVVLVTEGFFRYMLEDERAEKRYVRMLQKIASEALHDIRRPLRDRIGELLRVIVEAMRAKNAALLLFDAHANRLVTAASRGTPEFEAYATSLAPESFARQIAASESPRSMRDVTTAALDVPESLRESGIHSVLGVRIPRQDELVGILTIGIAEIREFAPREIHRLELLADRLALHLENARLFAELRETIDSLHVERGVRERFVSLLAHDLRGPLSAARLAAELIVDTPDSLDVRRDLALRVERNIERADRMIRDLLDANRIRAGEPMPLRLDTCDLCAVAMRVAEEARTLYSDRFVVECEVARGIWSADELHRAIWNLVTNAVKYGAAKQPITITVESGPATARVSVHNVGAPIPAGELSSLFDAFHRSISAQAGKAGGWGLGLALVRSCAEAHGGHASVTSDERGTTFTMELPLDSTPYQHHAVREATVH